MNVTEVLGSSLIIKLSTMKSVVNEMLNGQRYHQTIMFHKFGGLHREHNNNASTR